MLVDRSSRAGRLAIALALVAGSLHCGPPPLPADPVSRYEALLNQAWGPESPAVLDKYLAVRKALQPKYQQFEEAMTQHSLRELSTRPLIGAALFALVTMRRDADKLLKEQQLSFDDYQRLTILVYGRWLRATRQEDPPEKRMVRSLQELQVALERRLANQPPTDADALNGLNERIASVRHQLHFTIPFGLMDKSATLAAIDPGTRNWLDEHRQEIEALDFRLFDTATPERAAVTQRLDDRLRGAPGG